MERWEYLPTYLEASAKAKEIKEYLKENVPGVKKPPRYMVESLMPQLNEMGAEGWELVHMEPVANLGKKGDVLIGAEYRWSNVYFCVFKRRVPGTVPAVMPVTSAGTPAFSERNAVDSLPIAPIAPITPPKPPASSGE